MDAKLHDISVNDYFSGKQTEFKALKLAPCTCYDFRVKVEDDEDWIYFKAATEDNGLNFSVMHMSRAVRLGKMSVLRKIAHHRSVFVNVSF